MQPLTIKPRFLYDAAGNKTEVILRLADFERLLERIEDLQDALDFDEAMAEPGELIGIDELRRQLFGE